MNRTVFLAGPASWNTIVHLDQLPEPRPHTVFARREHDTLGGTSAGKALHLVDLGEDVVLHTVVGRDPTAEVIRSALTGAGVPVSTWAGEGHSERHLNLMTEAGERLSIYLGPAHDAGVEIWTDLHDYDGRQEFHRPFVEAATYVFLNADGLGDPTGFMRSCVQGGARTAVCTLGARGAIAVDEHFDWHEVPASPVPVVDTNGAGDAFLAGFLAATLKGGGVRVALRAAARQATRALGSQHLSPLLDPVLRP